MSSHAALPPSEERLSKDAAPPPSEERLSSTATPAFSWVVSVKSCSSCLPLRSSCHCPWRAAVKPCNYRPLPPGERLSSHAVASPSPQGSGCQVMQPYHEMLHSLSPLEGMCYLRERERVKEKLIPKAYWPTKKLPAERERETLNIVSQELMIKTVIFSSDSYIWHHLSLPTYRTWGFIWVQTPEEPLSIHQTFAIRDSDGTRTVRLPPRLQCDCTTHLPVPFTSQVNDQYLPPRGVFFFSLKERHD